MSNPIDSKLLPHIQIRLGGVNHHRWKPGQMIDWPDTHAASLDSATYVLWLMIQGGVFVSQQGVSNTAQRTWEIPSHTLVLWPMNLPRRIATPQGGEWLSIQFHALVFDRVNLCDMLNPPRLIEVTPHDWQFLKGCAEQLLTLCHGESPAIIDRDTLSLSTQQLFAPVQQEPIEQWTAQSLTQTIFGYCWMACSPETQTTSPQIAQQELPVWLVNVLEQSQRNAFNKVSEMAHYAGFSEAQFRRLFQQWAGIPPHQYLHEQRMRRARHMLEKSELTIGEIAETLGFSSVSHFIQAFKSLYGKTPHRYRLTYLRPVL